MENMNTHSVNYNNINIFIDIKGNKGIIIDDREITLNTLYIILTKKDQTKLNLGVFYAILPKILTDEDLKELVRVLIDNIDDIIFEKGRYIGELSNGIITYDKSISNYLIDKNIREYDVKLKDIYLEFFDLKKGTKEFKKYSYFLELEFISRAIPDNIKKIFLKRKKKSILDYSDNELNEQIKSDFKNNIYDDEETFKYEMDVKKLKVLKEKINKLVNELNMLETIIDNILKVLNKIDNNKNINNEIIYLEDKISNMSIFNRDKRIFSNKKKELQNSLILINMEEELIILKNEIECFPFIKINSFDSIETINKEVTRIYNLKNKKYDALKEEYNLIYDRIHEYEENKVDISELRDRLDN